MVRNKNESRTTSTENRRGTQGDKMTNDRTTRGAPQQEDLRENTGKADRATQSRKGSAGKLNDH